MPYTVKETFFTLQGEGAQSGRAAVFLRFAGCNLWSGREGSRASAVCRFCDTDFVGTDGEGGGHFADAAMLANHVLSFWQVDRPDHGRRYVVCTGGEPLLQLDTALIDALHERGFAVAVETNGTIQAPPGIDWLTVSPKADATLLQTCGDELKLVFPQDGGRPERYEGLRFGHFFVQPMDGPHLERNTKAAIDYCRQHPRWQLSLQTHKLLGIP
jgi:7-carboxy-7-deazaguanine synthase (Cx14CxxC type)